MSRPFGEWLVDAEAVSAPRDKGPQMYSFVLCSFERAPRTRTQVLAYAGPARPARLVSVPTEGEIRVKIKTTKFGYLEKAHVAKVGERQLPEQLDEHEVLVHMQGQNLCTTDYQQWMGLREHQGYPMAGGHEGAGVVVEVGSAVHSVKPGDFVAMAHDNFCGECEECRVGHTENCLNPRPKDWRTEDGYVGGMFGFAQYKVVRERVLYKMNPELTPAEAGFLEPVATVVSGMRQLRVQPHETVVVVGAGTMGLANAQVAKAFGARVIVSELMENKIEAARKAGLEVIDSGKEDVVARVKELTDGKGADAVILAVSNKVVLDQAFDLIKELRGRILIFAAGYPAPQTTLDANPIHYRRIEIIGTFGANTCDFQEAANLLNSRAVDVRPMCEPKQYDLSEIQQAYEAASTPGMYRVHVNIPE